MLFAYTFVGWRVTLEMETGPVGALSSEEGLVPSILEVKDMLMTTSCASDEQVYSSRPRLGVYSPTCGLQKHGRGGADDCISLKFVRRNCFIFVFAVATLNPNFFLVFFFSELTKFCKDYRKICNAWDYPGMTKVSQFREI